jgi:hypothetical protein|tara:strand:- start:2802 stop:2990 length:189 start_codon:yes stop_codon:yes gene_type:complete
MSNITNIIAAAVAEKPNETYNAFSDAIQPKLVAALSAKYDEVSLSVFNQTQTTDTEDDNDER